MFSSRRANNLINRSHERSLRTVHNDSTFQELVQPNKSYNIRKFQEMRQEKIRTLRYSLETALYRAPERWSLFPAV